MATKEEKNTFSTLIARRAEKFSMSYIDSFVSYCEESEIEIEAAASLVNDQLKSRIKEEAQMLNFLPKGSKLPL